MQDPTTRFALDDLRAFAQIAGAGGISAAARRHDEPKANLARALARLEEAAGMALFDRVGRGLKLTAFGESLVDSGERALRLDQEVEAVRRASSGEPSGPLQVAASALTAVQLVAPVLARVAADHPAVRSRLVITSAGPDPLDDELDVVVRIGRPSAPYLVARRVLVGTLRLYCSPAIAAGMDVSDPNAVESLERVVVDVERVPTTWVVSDEAGRSVSLARPPIVSVGDPMVSFALMRNDVGMAFLPDVYAEGLVAAGELVRLLPSFSGPPIEIFLAFPPRRSNVPAVRLFIDPMVERCERLRAEGVSGPALANEPEGPASMQGAPER